MQVKLYYTLFVTQWTLPGVIHQKQTLRVVPKGIVSYIFLFLILRSFLYNIKYVLQITNLRGTYIVIFCLYLYTTTRPTLPGYMTYDGRIK